jgi:hypothetical protein
VYDYFAQSVRLVKAGETVSDDLGNDGFKYYVIAEPGKSGIAFLGDVDKFVSNGKQRIASIKDENRKLTVTIAFAPNDPAVRLHGCCASIPTASVDGKPLTVTYDSNSRHFIFDVPPPKSSPNASIVVVIENQ